MTTTLHGELDTYTLDERIGGAGSNWTATDSKGGLFVVKLPEINGEKYLKAYQREKHVLNHVAHDHLVEFQDANKPDEQEFLAIKYVRGFDLNDLVHLGRPLEPALCVSIFDQICQGVQTLHNNGYVHRDLKPENILLDCTGTTPRVRVADFGLTHHEELDHLEMNGQSVGTPAYSSPEQSAGLPPSPVNDIYSLGLTLYECLTGKRAKNANTEQGMFMQHLLEPVPDPRKINPRVPLNLALLVIESTRRQKNKRLKSIQQFRDILTDSTVDRLVSLISVTVK